MARAIEFFQQTDNDVRTNHILFGRFPLEQGMAMLHSQTKR